MWWLGGGREASCLRSDTGSDPALASVQVLVWPGFGPGLCVCMCWRPVKGQRSQAGSISDGCKS